MQKYVNCSEWAQYFIRAFNFKVYLHDELKRICFINNLKVLNTALLHSTIEVQAEALPILYPLGPSINQHNFFFPEAMHSIWLQNRFYTSWIQYSGYLGWVLVSLYIADGMNQQAGCWLISKPWMPSWGMIYNLTLRTRLLKMAV